MPTVLLCYCACYSKLSLLNIHNGTAHILHVHVLHVLMPTGARRHGVLDLRLRLSPRRPGLGLADGPRGLSGGHQRLLQRGPLQRAVRSHDGGLRVDGHRGAQRLENCHRGAFALFTITLKSFGS